MPIAAFRQAPARLGQQWALLRPAGAWLHRPALGAFLQARHGSTVFHRYSLLGLIVPRSCSVLGWKWAAPWVQDGKLIAPLHGACAVFGLLCWADCLYLGTSEV